ncbi:hypothetical protein SAMN04488689_105393 [Paenibacillus sp. cl6col]|uniref:hypothetical protein n=1 Tax=Paenibacillus sp. cl6col TaxID=1761878 RepID=UPI0008823B88|nr:hypothetical protein [Paenibacillus sp. cl6col]SDF57212.1 hypothetical protein SAMN04488689_105393 [Paenibacillus sp. cl6col]
MKPSVKRLLATTLSTAIIFSVTSPVFANVVPTATTPSSFDNSNLSELDRIELELRQVDYVDLFRTVGTNLGIVEASGEASTLGWKSKAAKEIAKDLIKKLKNVGSRAWNEQIANYVNKIPLLSEGAKDKLKYYLGYQVLMEALDVMLNFTGIAEDGLTYAFEYMGLPKWLAEIAARAIVFFLL